MNENAARTKKTAAMISRRRGGFAALGVDRAVVLPLYFLPPPLFAGVGGFLRFVEAITSSQTTLRYVCLAADIHYTMLLLLSETDPLRWARFRVTRG